MEQNKGQNLMTNNNIAGGALANITDNGYSHPEPCHSSYIVGGVSRERISDDGFNRIGASRERISDDGFNRIGVSRERISDDGFKQKYLKYKSKYIYLKRQKGGNEKNIFEIKSLVIYPQMSLVEMEISKETELLPGFVEDSVSFFGKDNKISTSSVNINRGTYNDALAQNKNIEITTIDGTKINGNVVTVDPKIISAIDSNNDLFLVRKWAHAKIKTVRQNKPMFMANESGVLRYTINSIVWNPIYNLYLDSENFETSTTGELHFIASIKNTTNYSINADKIVLVYGNLIMDEIKTPQRYGAMALRSEKRMEITQQPEIEEVPFSELLTFPISDGLAITEDLYNIPISIHSLKFKKIYVIILSNIGGNDKQFVEASFGYQILVDRDLPGGLLRMFAIHNGKQPSANLSLGSVKINRIPKDQLFDVILGKTTRVRASISKQNTNMDVEKGVFNKLKYRRSKITINAEIINDTDETQRIVIKDWIGNFTIQSASDSPQRKMNYLEWLLDVKPGKVTKEFTYEFMV